MSKPKQPVNDNNNDAPYGVSPAMQALPDMRKFNALPIGSPERRRAISYCIQREMLEQAVVTAIWPQDERHE